MTPSAANPFKEKNVVSRKNTTAKKGVFGKLSSKSSSTTTNGSQLYDDGSNATYPPPQKQTGQR